MKPAVLVAVLAALFIAGPGHAGVRSDSVLWTAGASFLDHLKSDGIPGGVFSLDARSFQSASSAGSDFGKLNVAAKPARGHETYAMLLTGLGLLGWIALRRSKVLHAAG